MRVWTPYGELSYPHLDEAYSLYGTTRKFSACLRLPVGWWDLDSDLLDAVARAGLGCHRTLDFRMPVRLKEYRRGLLGGGPPVWQPTVVASSTARPPRTPFVEFHPGRRCRLLVEPWAWQRSGVGRGVALTLLAVEAAGATTPEDALTREAARLAHEAARLAQAAADLARMQSYY